MSFATCLLLLLIGGHIIKAQDATPSPTPENEELKKLKEQNEILAEQKKAAEAQKAIVEAQKAIFDANKAVSDANNPDLPKPTATPLEGKTELEGVKIETEMISYRALNNLSAKIAELINQQITANNKTKIAILNENWLTGLRDYWGTKNKFKLLDSGYQAILNVKFPTVPIKNPYANQEQIGQFIHGPVKIIPPLPKPEQIAKLENTRRKNFLTNRIKKHNSSSGNEMIDSMSNGNTDFSKITNEGSSFATKVAAVSSTFGAVGSVVGAAIDLMALARTDTKITGFTFTPQESALVSSVYAKINSQNKYYPVEFSPNLNLQKPSVIISEIQAVSDLKDQSDNILSNIEDTEKALKELNSAKDVLESRGEELPKLIEEAEKKLTSLKEPTNKGDNLNIKISEQQDVVDKLNQEKTGLPKKLAKNADNIEKLALKLSQLYRKIEPVASDGEVVNGFLEIAQTLEEISTKFLIKRVYALEEIVGLTKGDKAVFKVLIEEAEKKLGKPLTEVDKDELLNPYEMDRLKIFVKIAQQMRKNQTLPTQLEPYLFLSDLEQLKLAYLDDASFLFTKSKVEKSRGNKIIKLKSLNKQFDKYYEDLTKSDTAGVNPLTKHLQTENIMDAFGCNKQNGDCSDASALVLKVVDVGGNNRVKKNLLTMAITGADITHSGGAIVEYKYYDFNGKVLMSGICTGYESYQKAEKIKNANPNGFAICQDVSATNTNVTTPNQDPEAETNDNKKNTPAKTKPELKKPEN
ncbi:MAG: hypothetical protein K1X72_04200 [Pyrinomonadaceae bacterium]|nr:hypothetical protein [Pyrinomonadaceae bacterium]